MWLFGHIFLPFWLSATFYMLANIADAVTTKIALDKGGKEFNPLLSWIKNTTVLALVSGGIGVAAGIPVILSHDKYPLAMGLFCLILGSIRLIVAGFNIRNIVKLNKTTTGV